MKIKAKAGLIPDLCKRIEKFLNMKVTVIPVVIRDLGIFPKA